MDTLFLLNPTADAVLKLQGSARQRVYQRLIELLRDSQRPAAQKHTERLTAHVCISQVPLPEGADLRLAFARLKEQVVILQIDRSLQDFRKEQLETAVDTLKHLDLANLGLRFEAQPDEPDIGSRLDRALNLYCRVGLRQRTPRLAMAYEDAASEVVRRLMESEGPTWTSTDARQRFKDVLDGAELRPQVIERGARRFLVVEESRLPALVARKNASEMYRYFFEDSPPIEPFDRVRGTRPGRLLDVS